MCGRDRYARLHPLTALLTYCVDCLRVSGYTLRLGFEPLLANPKSWLPSGVLCKRASIWSQRNRSKSSCQIIQWHALIVTIQTLVSVATIAAEYTLKVSFPFDASLLFLLNSQIESLHPVSFTSRLIRRGDAGSLHSYLKTKGWLTSSFADQEDTPLGFSTLYISMTLTQEGFGTHIALPCQSPLTRYADRHRDVLFAVFDYLSFLRSSTFEPWRHAERRKFATISFDFGNKESPENLR